ncbi:MAG: mechanosensitive ion channel family protein, partial [Lachnospiraceae bacterium]
MTKLAGNTIEESPEIIAEATKKVGRLANYMDMAFPKIISFGIEVILALVFFCIGAKLIKWVRKIVRKSLERSSADVGVEQFVDSFLKFTLYLLLIVVIAMKFGLEPA